MAEARISNAHPPDLPSPALIASIVGRNQLCHRKIGRAIARASHASHMFPHLAESWAVLAAAARVSQSPATSSAWLTRVVSHVTRLGAGNTALTDWAARVAASL